ncbi:hypothetical protein TanjilG_30735 [Lupinus angustifolius]|uniref:Uncharacterized protein n=1 Tax=Lupinus angustifolius TaxID=3871 RepID=A0A1J7GT01_LUPAN|nr:hypothetical protein TanjilG_30735 [Lupinus angustifolius]
MVVSQDHSKLNSSFILDLIVNLVSANPSISVKAVVKEVVSHFDYTVTYRKAWTAKQMAYNELYNELPRWMNALQYFSPGTIVKYEARHRVVDGIEDPSRIILDRILWAFKPCIEGFVYCKPILQVGETFFDWEIYWNIANSKFTIWKQTCISRCICHC